MSIDRFLWSLGNQSGCNWLLYHWDWKTYRRSKIFLFGAILRIHHLIYCLLFKILFRHYVTLSWYLLLHLPWLLLWSGMFLSTRQKFFVSRWFPYLFPVLWRKLYHRRVILCRIIHMELSTNKKHEKLDKNGP